MHDDDLTPLHELASSHLDADNSPEERAHVAATPELQSLVASFEEVRARLADVPPAPAAARESALAAALAAFDELQADSGAAAPRPAAPVISLDSRRRWPQRMMGIAAAVAAVGVIGIGATQLGGSDDKSSTSADTAAKAEFDARIESAESAPQMDQPMSTIGTIGGGGASVATVINSLEELAALPVPGDTMISTAGEEPSVAPDVTEAAAETSIATPATAAPNDGGGTSYFPSALPAAACLTGDQVYLADVVFQGQLAVAARDMVTGVTYAIANDCNVLASVGP